MAPRWGLVVAGLAALGGCARQEVPPGGPEDRRPPVVVETFPEPLGVLTDLDASVRFGFDERISERVASGDLSTAFTISPRGGALEVDKGSRSLEVRPEDGFQPGLVYRVTLQAVVSDLFGNRMTDPFELVFTTGDAEPVPTTLAGEVWDRVTGRPVSDARVLAVADDGVVHQAVADRDGIFALRYLPGGEFRITAFEDQDRDGEVDSTEVQGRTSVDLAVGDTLLTDVSLLTPDTSEARVTAADVLTAASVVVTFDDFLDPEADASGFDVSLTVSDSVATGFSAPEVERVLQEAEYASWVETVTDSLARLDSIRSAEAARESAARAAADSVEAAAVDTSAQAMDSAARPPVTPDTIPGAPAPPDTVRIEPPSQPAQDASRPRPPPTLDPLEGVSAGPTPDGRRILPGRRIVVFLSDTLPFDVVHEVVVDGVANVVGLPGGGGAAEVVRERPPPPDSVADSATVSDSADAVGDSAAVPDTGSVALVWPDPQGGGEGR